MTHWVTQWLNSAWLHCIQHIVQTQANLTILILHWTIQSALSTMHIKHYTIFTSHCTHTYHCKFYSTHCTVNTSNCTFRTENCIFILHTVHYTLHTANCILHTAHSTLHTAHHTLPHHCGWRGLTAAIRGRLPVLSVYCAVLYWTIPCTVQCSVHGEQCAWFLMFFEKTNTE